MDIITIAHIHEQGSTFYVAQNILAVEIWEYVKNMCIHKSAAHIPGEHSIMADEASRKFQDAAE